MLNESATMKKIHDIRLSIYEKIKDMTPEECTAYFSDSTKDTIEKYGIKVVTPADIRKNRTVQASVN